MKIIDVKNCQRCDQDHDSVQFDEIEPRGEYTHQGQCPVTGMPLIFRSGDTPEPVGSEEIGQKYVVRDPLG